MEHPRVGTIRIVDGKLQLDGVMPHPEFFEKEYARFKAEHPEGTDRDFLEDWINLLYIRTTYVQSQFVPEG